MGFESNGEGNDVKRGRYERASYQWRAFQRRCWESVEAIKGEVDELKAELDINPKTKTITTEKIAILNNSIERQGFFADRCHIQASHWEKLLRHLV